MRNSNEVVVKFLGDGGGLSRTMGGLQTGMASLGTAATVGFAAVAAGVATAGAALFKLGNDFDAAYDNIIVGTGASGSALEGLQDDFRAIARETPAGLDDISVAVADLNTRLGLTGEPLQDLSSRMLDMSRITGTDLSSNIANVTRLFGDQGIAAEDQAFALDQIFEATKRTGIGLERLTTLTTQYGAPLRQLGFGFEEQLALFGKWEQEGVNIETVMAGMRQGLARLAAAGEEPAEGFQRLFDEIQNAATAGEATAIALEGFGSRAGPDMAAAIREGRFEISDLVASLGESGGALDDAVDRTNSWRETLTVLTNNLKIGLEPVANRVFKTISAGAERILAWWEDNGDDITARATAAFARIQEWWDTNGARIIGNVQDFAMRFAEIMAPIGDAVSVAFDRLVPAVQNIVDTVQTIWDKWGDEFMVAFEIVVAGISLAIEGLATFISGIVKVIQGIFEGDWDRIWEGAREILVGFSQAFVGIFGALGGILWAALTVVKDVLVGLIERPLNATVNFVSERWDVMVRGARRIPGLIGDALSAVGNAIWNPIKGGIDSAVGFVTAWPDRIGRGLDRVTDAVTDFGSDIWTAFRNLGRDALNGLMNALTGAAGFAGDVASGVLQAVKDVINTTIIDPINARLQFDIDPPGPGPSFQFAANVPRLATGGVTGINDPFLAMIGDNKTQREIVTPEDLMRDIIRQELDASTADGGGGVTLHVDTINQTASVEELADELAWLMTRGVN